MIQGVTTQPFIRIVTALVRDELGRVLLVRKRGTQVFMQPGGKLEPRESELAALDREQGEELGCRIDPESAVFLGRFKAPAANERGYMVDAALYGVSLIGPVVIAAEVEEMLWLDPVRSYRADLAPLTRETVLPLAASLLRLSPMHSPSASMNHDYRRLLPP